MDERRQHSLFQQLTQLEYGIQVHHHDMLRDIPGFTSTRPANAGS